MERCFILLIGGLLAAIVEQQIITLVDTIFIAPSRRKKTLENKTWKSVTAEEVSKYAEPDKSGHYSLFYKWRECNIKYVSLSGFSRFINLHT